jgi:hypothetical protein
VRWLLTFTAFVRGSQRRLLNEIENTGTKIQIGRVEDDFAAPAAPRGYTVATWQFAGQRNGNAGSGNSMTCK